MNVTYNLTSHVLKKTAKCMKASLLLYQFQYKKQACNGALVKIADFKKGRSNHFFPIHTAGYSLQTQFKRRVKKDTERILAKRNDSNRFVVSKAQELKERDRH